MSAQLALSSNADTAAETTAGRWYCVHAKPRAETLALEHLSRQGFRCLLPRVRRILRIAGTRRASIEAYFPRYLFLHADTAVQSLAAVRSTRGVIGLVRFGGEPAEVPSTLIQRLQQNMDDTGVVAEQTCTPAPGESVRIVDGPFAELDGIFSERCGETRAIVLLRLMNTEVRATIALDHLRQKTASARFHGTSLPHHEVGGR